MRLTRIQVYWYLDLLTVSTLPTVSYQMDVILEEERTATRVRERIETTQ